MLPARSRSFSRKRPTRSIKRKFYIFCEGKRTEPDYFLEIEKKYGNSKIEFDVVGGIGVPSTITKKAKEKKLCIKKSKNSFEKKDQVWSLFDRDEFSCYWDSIQDCKLADIGVGYSNPCFELWLILHKKDYDKPSNRHVVQKEAESCLPGYDRHKRKTTNCSELMSNIDVAIKRSETKRKRRLEEGLKFGDLPSTSVDMLITEIIKENKKNK